MRTRALRIFLLCSLALPVCAQRGDLDEFVRLEPVLQRAIATAAVEHRLEPDELVQVAPLRAHRERQRAQ